ncbi:hypothetical protein ACFSNO_31300 [Streptomyces cirratus]
MTRPPARAGEPAPRPPAGLALRHCGTDEADRRRAHALVEETFAAHFGHVERAYEPWLDHLDARNLDWTLVWIATLPALGDVAVSSPATTTPAWAGSATSAYARTCAGGHRRVPAAPRLRRLRRARAGHRRPRRRHRQRKPALWALYEAHGMRLHYAVDTWELRLHPQG